MRGAGEELRLKLGAGGDNVAAGAIQNFRMAAEGAGCGARRVQKDRVEFLARLPDKRVRLDELGFEMRPIQVLAQPWETRRERIDGGDPMTRRCELHRLAARCRAEVEHVLRGGWNQTCRERRGQILHPPPTFAKAGQVGDGAAFDSHMVGCNRIPTVFGRIRPGVSIFGEAEIERWTFRNLATCYLDGLLAPRGIPALLNVIREAW